MTEEERRASVIDFVNRSFRDMADQDYIGARGMYRAELFPQFLWLAHQAIEKYLKAILLYNDVSTIDLSHDIEKALSRLDQITDIPFDVPPQLRAFIARLNEQGPNRYFEYPAVLVGDELHMLDQSVWWLRRYCHWMRGTARTPGGVVNRLQHEIEVVNSFGPSNAHRFRIRGGRLESLLSKRKDARREMLVWKNFFYGSRKKRRVRFTRHGMVSNPAHYLDPEIFEDLKTRVQFSKAVKAMFNAHK